MRKFITFCFTFVLVSSCGQQPTSSTPSKLYDKGEQESEIFGEGYSARDQKTYESLRGPDLFVDTGDLIGSTITQRESKNLFCRKIGAVVPNPDYSYECWQSDGSDDEAKLNYDSIDSGPYSINISGRVGSSKMEKVNGQRTLLCQRVEVTYPGALGRYSCYKRL